MRLKVVAFALKVQNMNISARYSFESPRIGFTPPEKAHHCLTQISEGGQKVHVKFVEGPL